MFILKKGGEKMRQYTGNNKIVAVGPCVSNFGGGYVLLDNIRYGIEDKILVAYVGSDGLLYNAHWCIVHTDAETGRSYINIYRCRYWLDDFMRV